MFESGFDYLKEFISNDKNSNFLREIISMYISSNGKLTDSDLEQLAENLLIDKKFEVSPITKVTTSYKQPKISIKRLKHIQGVNALATNQEIKFSTDMTLLFGYNGSGKSSYYRILQTLKGDLPQNDLLPNIYKNKNETPKVEIEYFVNNRSYKETRENLSPIKNLQSVKVFDTSISQIFLNKKDSDTQIIQPYNLFVFSQISEYIIKINEIAKTKIREKLDLLPSLDFSEFPSEIREILSYDFIKEEDINKITTISDSFNSQIEQNLINLKKEINDLSYTNYDDKIEIIDNKITELEKLYKHIKENIEFWISKSEEYYNNYLKYVQYKVEVEETKAKIEVLNNLPGSDSNNWEAFIREGTYISENTPELNSKCPYCHRDHDDKSLELVQAYLVYLNNESTKDLSDTEKLLKSIASLASTTSVKNNDISLDSYRNLEDIEALSTNVGNYINNLKSNQEELKEIQPIKYKTDKIMVQIQSHIKELKSQKKIIEETKLEKNKLIEEKKNEYQKLVLHQNTHNKIDTIKKYISEKNEIFKQNERVNKNNTRQLSNLSKKAHDELLSQQLVNQFQKNLSYFEIPNREISLKNITSAGKQQTELIIKSNKKIKKILSEGEQKSVALALFLAEISLSKNKSTLIFDDPVNSLDNRLMNKFIKLLLELENQIIIFSHNQYFFDLLTTQKQLLHSCKENNYNGCTNKAGKHLLIYEVSSDGINDAGFIRFNNINTTAKAYLKKANQELQKTSYKKFEVVVSLRFAIDYIIDEVIFNNQTPRKYSMKNRESGINWKELKGVHGDEQTIDSLNKIFNRLSSAELHSGPVNINDPITKDELIQIYDQLLYMIEKS